MFSLVNTNDKKFKNNINRKSSRSEIVLVEPIYKDSGCSDKAIIISRSKYSDEQSAIIFAEDKSKTLSCWLYFLTRDFFM